MQIKQIILGNILLPLSLLFLDVSAQIGGIKLSISSPNLLQIEKKGNNFIMSEAHFGETYQEQKLDNSDLGTEFLAGLFVCAHSKSFVEEVEFTNTRISNITNKIPVKIALNAYSFNDLLTGKGQKDNNPTLTLPELLDWCATQDIDAIDLTGYYFPGYPGVPTDEYIYQLKRKAFQLGIDISGTGIRNNFASPDPAVRAADVERAKKWIIVASKLGAPVIRLFAGEIPKGYENKWDEVAGWMIECYKECAKFGEENGVIIGIQNHGDMLQSAEQCIKIVKAVNSNWVGIILDTGNFKVEDPYKDIEAIIPYAVNWQLKESVFGINSTVKTDYPHLVKIILKSSYRGYLPIETLAVKGIPYDPYVRIPAMIKELTEALNSNKN